MIRSLPQTNNSIKAGGWDRTKGLEVQGRTLGVIGTGQIGQHVAKMAAGLDMKVLDTTSTPMRHWKIGIPLLNMPQQKRSCRTVMW